MNRKKYHLIKTVCFIVLSILIFIFNEVLTNNAYLLVGGLMLMYGVEDLVYKYFTKSLKTHTPKVANDLLIIMLGIICFFLGPEEHFRSLCIIWATWAILREEWEIEELVVHYRSKFLALVSFVESIAVIVICVIFIFEPTLYHVHLHVIILGFELILEVLFPILDELLGGKKEHHEEESI